MTNAEFIAAYTRWTELGKSLAAAPLVESELREFTGLMNDLTAELCVRDPEAGKEIGEAIPKGTGAVLTVLWSRFTTVALQLKS